jgi:hypothetical protein
MHLVNPLVSHAGNTHVDGYIDNEADVNDTVSFATSTYSEDDAIQYRAETTETLVNNIHEFLTFSTVSDLLKLIAAQF